MRSFKQFLEEFTPIEKTQYGSNPGGLHVDRKGNKHYVKYYSNPDQAKTEALTGKLYKHMGIPTIDSDVHEINGRTAMVSKWNDRLKTVAPHKFDSVTKEQAHDIGKMYHAAILTKNWDIVGLGHDNIVQHSDTGAFHSIDHGGTFHFRARGSAKPYGSDIEEHGSLRNPNKPSGHVFNAAFRQHPEAERKSLDSVRNIDHTHVEGLFKNSGLANWQELHRNFEQRRKKLLAKYGE